MHAGIAVVAVMVITTSLLSLIMLVIWRTKIWWIALFLLVFGFVEGLYLSSVLYKFKQGGYLPLAFSLFLMMIMGIWHYVHKHRYMYELNNKVSPEYVTQLAANPSVSRVPGIGFFYSELVQGIPPIFPHFVANIPSIHSVLVFVSIKSLPISKVVPQERFLFRQVEPREYRMFRCVVRYGYKDAIEEPREFERQLVANLKDFIRHEHFIREGTAADYHRHQEEEEDHNQNNYPQHTTLLVDGRSVVRGGSASAVHVEESLQPPPRRSSGHRVSSSRSIRSSMNYGAANNTNSSSNGIISSSAKGGDHDEVGSSGAEEEMQFVQKAMEKGVVYLLGEAEVVAEAKSSLFKKIVVNYAYGFLRKNFRQGEKVMAIPRSKLLRVGMTYEI